MPKVPPPPCFNQKVKSCIDMGWGQRVHPTDDTTPGGKRQKDGEHDILEQSVSPVSREDMLSPIPPPTKIIMFTEDEALALRGICAKCQVMQYIKYDISGLCSACAPPSAMCLVDADSEHQPWHTAKCQWCEADVSVPKFASVAGMSGPIETAMKIHLSVCKHAQRGFLFCPLVTPFDLDEHLAKNE
jgi:hypothetical protein